MCTSKDEDGKRLAGGRLPEGVEGIARFHELVGAHAEEPDEVIIGIETDRGLFVGALVAAGYQVFAVNPMSTSRYRDRHSTSGAKSDPGDAKVLADMVRTDRHNHRPVAGDSEMAEAIKVLARAHQSMIWSRGRQTNLLRSTLREFYPAAWSPSTTWPAVMPSKCLNGAHADPRGGAFPFQDRSRPPPGGRQRRIDERAERDPSRLALSPARRARPWWPRAMGSSVSASVAVIATMTAQIAVLAQELESDFEQHPDAEVVRSLPGLGTILGARVLGEFGDEPNRYATAKCRKNYAGTSPITRASGTKRVVLARFARNQRLADAIYLWAFAALTASPGARAFYDYRRAAGDTHHAALRASATGLSASSTVVSHHSIYDENIAWAHRSERRSHRARLTVTAVGYLTCLPWKHTSALDIAAAIRAKEVSPLEVLDYCLARVDARNPELNAVIWRNDEQARAKASGSGRRPRASPARLRRPFPPLPGCRSRSRTSWPWPANR